MVLLAIFMVMGALMMGNLSLGGISSLGVDHSSLLIPLDSGRSKSKSQSQL